MTEYQKIQEELLVLRCQLGEVEAFEKLIELTNERLFYYVRRMVQDEDVASDVLQDVWIAVFRKIKTLREAKLFRVWVYRIAHDKAVTQIRRDISRERAEENYSQDAPDQNDDQLFGPGDAHLIHLVMNRLSPLHREVLTLSFLEELTYEEIAIVLHCNVGTVKSRLYYAKRALRRLMGESDHGQP